MRQFWEKPFTNRQTNSGEIKGPFRERVRSKKCENYM